MANGVAMKAGARRAGFKFSLTHAQVMQLSTSVVPEVVGGGRIKLVPRPKADQGKPCIVDLWRVSQGVTQQLAQLQQGFSNLEVSGSVLMDPNKVGAGISRYMRTTLV